MLPVALADFGCFGMLLVALGCFWDALCWKSSGNRKESPEIIRNHKKS
jgi:hypothetical protein